MKTTEKAIELLVAMGEELAGRDPARARDCLREAADLARAAADFRAESAATRRLGALATASGDHAEAETALERALALAREGGDALGVVGCLNALGMLRMRQGETEEALVCLRESLGRTTEAPRDPAFAAARAETLEHLGVAYRDAGDPKQALLYYQEALEIRRVAGDEAGIASCRNQLGSLCYRMGRFADAEAHFTMALEARRTLGDRPNVASTLNNLAGTCLLLGKLKEAARCFEESLALAKELGDDRRRAAILSNMGLLRSYEGRVDEADVLHRESLRIHRERGDPAGVAHALNNMSDLAVERGRLEEAVQLADECIRTWTRAGRQEALAKPWVNRGRALVELDRIAEARAAADAAVEAARRTGSDEYLAETNLLLARVLAREGNADQALAVALDAAGAAQRAASPALRAQAATELGRLQVEAGRLEAAKQELEQAARWVRGLPHPYDRACILAEQGRLLARAGSPEAGAERLRRALGEFETLGNARWQVRTLVDLAAVLAASDRAEAERLRARATDLAERHALGGLVEPQGAPQHRPAAGTVTAQAAALDTLASAWLAAAGRRSERLVDFVDPLFGFLRQTLGVRSARLVVEGERAAEDAAAEPDGRHARVERAEGGASASRNQARFVLISGDASAGKDAGRLEVAVSCPSNPARLFLGRAAPFDEEEVVSIEAVARLASLALEGPLERLGRKAAVRVEAGERFEGLIGSSRAMREVYRMIEQVAPADSSVLLTGESGTGKELAARAIHARSRRAGGPFVAINCPSIPRELIEAELFGHEKGAFTGAVTMRPGKVEVADGGTLFLDEVGDMAPATQVRLLRFLEEREFQRVGGRENRRVDVRILAATSRELGEAVERGDFRGDLFYRLNVVPLRMPALRERREDLPLLLEHFLARLAREPRPGRRVSARAMERLVAHDWPGNVRELRNAVEYMLTVGRDDVLDEEQLPEGVRRGAARGSDGAGGAAAGAPGGGSLLRRGETMAARLREVEAELIRATLEATAWNQSATARRLAITESMVRNRMKQYGIRRSEKGEQAS
jgi:DNA-binding NtrC family response regulator/tetratricopeptide (TPR) repeat protein